MAGMFQQKLHENMFYFTICMLFCYIQKYTKHISKKLWTIMKFHNNVLKST